MTKPTPEEETTTTSPLSIKYVVSTIIERMNGSVRATCCRTCGGELRWVSYGYCPKCMDCAYGIDGTTKDIK
jgi:hypothetical protein